MSQEQRGVACSLASHTQPSVYLRLGMRSQTIYAALKCLHPINRDVITEVDCSKTTFNDGTFMPFLCHVPPNQIPNCMYNCIMQNTRGQLCYFAWVLVFTASSSAFAINRIPIKQS